MMEGVALRSSSRKGSLVSTTSEYSMKNTKCVRLTSTDNILTVDDKFIRRPLKKTVSAPLLKPTSLGESSSPRQKSGMYRFPNGELFRPRTSNTKRTRPPKTHPHVPRNEPRGNSLTGSSQLYEDRELRYGSTRSSSMVSSVQQKPASTPKTFGTLPGGPYFPRSNSYNSIRLLNRSCNSDLSSSPHANQSCRMLQSNNLIRENTLETVNSGSSFIESPVNASIILRRQNGVSSDSNISSIFNLCRSSSTTPQTSISTSTEEVHHTDPSSNSDKEEVFKKESALNSSDESHSLKDLENIKDTDMPIIPEIPKDSVKTSVPDVSSQYSEEKESNAQDVARLIPQNKTEQELESSKLDTSNEERYTDTGSGDYVISCSEGLEMAKKLETLHEPSRSSSYEEFSNGSTGKFETGDPSGLNISETVNQDGSMATQKTESPKSVTNEAFYEYEVTEHFTKFLNDKQKEVPPRGDVAVIGNKIRKHRRSASSISSFVSILQNEGGSNVQSPREVTPELALNESFTDVVAGPAKAPSGNPGCSNTCSVAPEESSLKKVDMSTPKKSLKDEVSDLKGSKAINMGSGATGSHKSLTLGLQDRNPSMRVESHRNNEFRKKMTETSALRTPNNLKKSSTSNIKTNKQHFDKGKNALVKESQNNKKKMKKSSSFGSLKMFLKKIVLSSDEKKQERSSATKSALRTRSSTAQESQRFKRSFSFSSFRQSFMRSENSLAPKQTNTIDTIRTPDSSDLSTQNENLTLTALPTIETEQGIYDEILVSFDEKLRSVDLVSSKPSKSINELFIRDDELSQDQIKDQQIKDSCQPQDREVQEEEEDDDNSGQTEHSQYLNKPATSSLKNKSFSDDEYMDENIRFLQDELVLPSDGVEEYKFLEELSSLGHSISLDGELDADTSSVSGPIIIDSTQMLMIFGSDINTEKGLVPGYFKHIKQFKDFDKIEVYVKKFDSLSNGIGLAVDSSIPILKRDDNKRDKKCVKFSNQIFLSETFSPELYKRYNKSVTQYTLTDTNEINRIKSELNEYKCKEMLVHERSQRNTHFFY